MSNRCGGWRKCLSAACCPREIAEVALAHALRDKTEAAYQRGDLLEKRRALMADLATYCTSKPASRIKWIAEDEEPTGFIIAGVGGMTPPGRN